MFLKIVLCFSACIVASANNVIPAQTYPIYQQNGYTNTQVNQPSNIQPYLQSNTAQNQVQQLNISPSVIKQALLNRLLASQPVQTIQDPNARSYSPNLNAVQSNHVQGHLASNYVVQPRDYLKNNNSYSNIDTNVNDNTKKLKQGKKRRPRLRRPNDINVNESSTNTQEKSDTSSMKNKENVIINNDPPRKHARKQNTQALETEINTTNTDNENKDNTRHKRRRQKQKEQTTEPPVEEKEEIKPENTKPVKRRRKQKLNEDTQLETISTTTPKPTEIENVDLDITKEGMLNENRLIRNLKQESNDIQKTVTNKPVEVTNNVKSNLNHQFSNPMMGNWFGSFGNMYQSLANKPQATAVNEVKPKRRRKSRRNRKPKRKHSHNKNITEVASITNSTMLGSVSPTTEKAVLINEKTQTNLNSNPPKKSSTSLEVQDLSSNEIFRDGYNINEFENRYDTGYYGGYIDDYYPLFTDSAAYNANNKEIILKNLNDNKYYYATDMIDTEFSKKHHKQDNVNPRLIDYDRNRHTYDEIEKESIRNAYRKEFDDKFEERLQFRSPPHLESPDFKTRQIDKSELKPEVYYVYDDNYKKLMEDKSSSYSNAKVLYNSGAKRNEIKTKPKDVETVYARSKAVSYGPVYNPVGDSSLAATNNVPWQDSSFESDRYQSGETAYIVAKSFDYLEA